jgi:crotonobetainyl-CoA:carnitine CoA-transferase CaiB-like acyl-CoA transferase
MNGAISELRILELGSAIATEFCGKLFAGFGASVLRVELRGAAAAQKTPTLEDRLTPDFAWYNTGKTNVVVDPDRAADRALLARLAGECDVVVEGLGPGGLERLLGSVDDLRRRNPGAVVVRVSSFGQTGASKDLPAEEITLYALSGAMYSTGEGEREPLNSTPRICSTTAGLRAFSAALMGILRRNKLGRGDVADLAISEAALDLFEVAIAEYIHLGKVPRRNGDDHAMVPWRSYPCKDGYAVIIGGPPRRWPEAAKVFGDPRLASFEFAHMGVRIQRRRDVEAMMRPWLQSHDKLTIYHEMQARKLACSYVATLRETLESPQNKARKAFIELEQPGVGRLTVPDVPFRAAGLPWQTRSAPRPNSNSCDPASLWPSRPASATASAPTQSPPEALTAPPLAGLKVVDFSVDWAGPHATRFLSDYGAEVVKIEYPGCIDRMRGGFLNKLNEHPRIWHLHRNKSSVTLDLNVPEHLEACKAIIREADVVVENSRPGVMAKLGLGYEVLKQTNPRLIYLSMSAFGATGPESGYAGYGGSIEAISGLQSLTGYSPDGAMLRIKEIDVVNGVFGICAILAALVQRDVTGCGEWIDLSERETTAWLIGEFYARYSATGIEPRADGNHHPDYVPQGCYPCTGTDRWTVLSVRSDEEWTALVAELGDADLAGDARLATAAGRRQHRDLIDERIRAWTATQAAGDACARLLKRGIPAAPVHDVRDVVADPQLAARSYFIDSKDGRYPGYAYRFAEAGTRFLHKGPNFGEHNEPILGGVKLPRSAWPDLRPEKLKTGYYIDPAAYGLPAGPGRGAGG